MTTVAPGVIETFDSIERTWKNGCCIGASYHVIVEEEDVETFAAASVAEATTFFAKAAVSSGVSVAPICATVVMGGLITEARKAMDDKIPFLGDLPYIGRLFRSHAEKTTKRNLLIFVTGRLITPSGRELRVNQERATDAAEVKPAPKAE